MLARRPVGGSDMRPRASSGVVTARGYPGVGAGEAPSWVVDALRAAGCVFAEDEAAILFEAASDADELVTLLRRRVDGSPLEYIVGWAGFDGLRVAVEPGVFVPRRRSELLVREAESLLRGFSAPIVVDLCCGSGGIGLAIATRVPGVELHAADLDPRAVGCARRNLAPAGGTVYQGDLFDPLPATLRDRVQVLVANAPYVPTAAIALLPPEARDHEPIGSLDGGPDGTDVLRRLIAGSPSRLARNGTVLVEVGESQIPRITAALESAGLDASVVTDDEMGAIVARGRQSRG